MIKKTYHWTLRLRAFFFTLLLFLLGLVVSGGVSAASNSVSGREYVVLYGMPYPYPDLHAWVYRIMGGCHQREEAPDWRPFI